MTSRQETRSGRRWILVALLVFMLCLVLWIAAAFILNIAFAESLPFSLGLRSRLAANYAPDDFVGSLGVFRLSIIDEVLQDRGLPPEDVEVLAGVQASTLREYALQIKRRLMVLRP